jgi:threonine/homoserine/homoserine lactone efflux protein
MTAQMPAWPIDPAIIGPFTIAIILVELTPGPNMAYLAALSASEGRGAGLRAVAGVTLGLAIYMLAAVFGVAQAIASAPMLYVALRWAGVAYLFYLARETWRETKETSPGHAESDARAPFWRGLIANLLNPKAAVFYVTLLPTFVAAHHGAFWRQALLLGSLHLLFSVIIHGAIVIGAARVGEALRFQLEARMFRRSAALAIAAIALWLGWETAAA